jgi:hypothetical protein
MAGFCENGTLGFNDIRELLEHMNKYRPSTNTVYPGVLVLTAFGYITSKRGV